MLKFKIVLAYFCLGFSLILFISYFLSKSFVSENVSDVLFYSSAIILGVCIILFRILINGNKKIKAYKTIKAPFDRVLEISYNDLLINSKNFDYNRVKTDYEDFDFDRADIVLSNRNTSKSIEHFTRCTIQYNSKNDKKIYFSDKINLDNKTLEIKLYLQKKVKLYINDKNGSYYFDLDFLNN